MFYSLLAFIIPLQNKEAARNAGIIEGKILYGKMHCFSIYTKVVMTNIIYSYTVCLKIFLFRTTLEYKDYKILRFVYLYLFV